MYTHKKKHPYDTKYNDYQILYCIIMSRRRGNGNTFVYMYATSYKISHKSLTVLMKYF